MIKLKQSEFYAKSRLPNGAQPTVKEHLTAVSKLAEQYGAEIGCADAAKTCGILHDFGKYSESFQNVLKRLNFNIDHAICGAVALSLCLKRQRKSLNTYKPMIEAINGHHDGLTEYSLLQNKLCQSVKSPEPVEGNQRKQAALAGQEEYKNALLKFNQDFPHFEIPNLHKVTDSLASMLFSRMLFSCLVDADYSISANEENPEYLSESQKTVFNAEQSLEKLYSDRESIRSKSNADADLNRLRDELFEQCGKMGSQPEGLFTLTAPTGTGKTLALLNFALHHCASAGKKRIIIVLPFLTLTEQNAKIYQSIFPDLLEDHSQSNLKDEEREFAARWSVPVIITTSVRFFESFFAYKPTDCRKLHNIANSVIIFDEAQSLPAELTSVTLQTVNELCSRYHCTMVFSTATQPDFDALKTVSWKPTEIMPDHVRLYKALKRTNVQWKLDEPVSLEKIADQMAQNNSVCAIVNLRKHARKLYNLLKDQCNENEIFLLTTDLCAAHRKHIVEKINKRLKANLPCRVAATQCIEAGIDFDFDIMYRALAPLDSIIQAAGRCNRNGRLPEGGKVTVFIPDEEGHLYPSTWYESSAQKVQYLNREHPIDIHNPEHIKEYYDLLFQSASDKEKLTKAIRNRSFADTDKEYRLIEDQGMRVIVPYEEELELYHSIREQALENGLTPKLVKKAASITVTVNINQKNKLNNIAEVIYYSERGHRSHRESNFYVLRPQNENCYTSDMGLQLPEKIQFDFF